MLKKLEAPENQGVMFSRTGRREGDLTVSSHGAGANSLGAARIPAWPPTVLDRLAAASGWDGLAAVAGRLGCDAAWEKGAASGRARARW
jgi:hypothetical protein